MPVSPWSVSRSNLPVAVTSFVGRANEIAVVRRLLSSSRLVTLIGAGGIGKTRLAVEVARRSVGDFPDGAWLVDLAALTDGQLVPQTTMASLGFAPSPTPEAALISLLQPRALLLVLDNCEHLTAACAHLADELLRSCPEVRVLATSRRVLGAAGETTWRVPSLAVPPTEEPVGWEELRRVEAPQLFLERAVMARPDLEIGEGGAASVARICRRLDGIPLAIELAAARVRSMSLRAIEEHLDDRFRFLTGGSQTSLPRHRTLQATVEWSYDLLDAAERGLFRRLSVFRGGFSLEATEAVCDDDAAQNAGDHAVSVLDGLSSLVDKSLLFVGEGSDLETRYRPLETIRQFAEARLVEAGEAERLAERHARYFCRFGERASAELYGARVATWFARLDEEIENIRVALEWCLQHTPQDALKLTVDIARFWGTGAGVGGLRQDYSWLVRALAAVPDRDELRATGLHWSSVWAALQGHFDEARSLASEDLVLAEELGSDPCIARALMAQALVRTSQRADGWEKESWQIYELAESHARAAGDSELLSAVLNNYGYTLYTVGDLAAARPKVGEALSLARSRNDAWSIATFLDSLVAIDYATGNIGAAIEHAR